MKKVFLAVIAFLGFALTSSAQDVAVKAAKKTEKVAKEVKKTETKTVLKKDGTPDKRFKDKK